MLKIFSLLTNFTVYGPDDEKIGEFRFKFGNFRDGNVPRVRLVLDERESGSVTGENEQKVAKDIQAGKKMSVQVSFLPPKAGLYVAMKPEAGGGTEEKIQLLAGAVVLKLFGFDKMFQQN